MHRLAALGNPTFGYPLDIIQFAQVIARQRDWPLNRQSAQIGICVSDLDS